MRILPWLANLWFSFWFYCHNSLEELNEARVKVGFLQPDDFYATQESFESIDYKFRHPVFSIIICSLAWIILRHNQPWVL